MCRRDVEYTERSPARLHGWQRRFWQGSTDHRGIPQAPGRVVTLAPEHGGECWGIAYLIDTDNHHHTIANLDIREQGGYEQCHVSIEIDNAATVTALTYIAGPDNRNYLGPATLPEMIEQIREACGPSGYNSEYVLNLAQAIREIGAHDEEVFELEKLIL